MLIPLFVPDDNLRAVRRGEWELPAIIDWLSRLERELRDLVTSSPLPQTPDVDWLNDWLHRAHVDYWQNGDCGAAESRR